MSNRNCLVCSSAFRSSGRYRLICSDECQYKRLRFRQAGYMRHYKRKPKSSVEKVDTRFRYDVQQEAVKDKYRRILERYGVKQYASR